MALFLAVWRLPLRNYYRVLAILESDGWDLINVDVGSMCFHPEVVNDVDACRRLVQIGLLPAWFSMEDDQPHLIQPAQID